MPLRYGEAEIELMNFFAVSDGMGGKGDYASHLIAEQMTKLFPKVFQSRLGMTVYFQDVLNKLVLERTKHSPKWANAIRG